jgi:hypothetical protein
MQVRAQVITDRWDERLVSLGEFRRRHAIADWNWQPQPMSCKAEPGTSTAV